MLTDNPFLEKSEEVEISTHDKLPHWHQDGKIQYVTFRLADSLPQSELKEIKGMIDSFKERNPEPWDKSVMLQYHRQVGAKFEEYLDNGLGECIFRNKECRDVLKDVIMFYDNVKYDVLAFVIMPNHVHLLLRLIDRNKLGKIMQSIKRQSSREINNRLNRQGTIWMKRYFDRIVRSEDHLKHYLSYIRDNPRFLMPGDFYLYVR